MMSSSPDLINPRLFHHPKSRSQLHHHHHHQHQPSWSSSLSAFSLQRSSAFLIDEYGNEHDPEHCQFKTLATPPPRRPTSSSSSSSSSSSNHSQRSSRSCRSTSSRRSSIRSLRQSPLANSSLSTPSSNPARPLQLLNRCILSTPHSQSTWSNIRTRQNSKSAEPVHPKLSHSLSHLEQENHPSNWAGKIWSHLRSSSVTHPSAPIHATPLRPSQSSSPLGPPFTPSSTSYTLFKNKRKRSITKADEPPQCFQDLSSPFASPHQPVAQRRLCGMRKRIELVKLDVRFGILRTRKRFVGVWKK